MRKRQKHFIPIILVAVPTINGGAATIFSAPDTTARVLQEVRVEASHQNSALKSSAPTHRLDAGKMLETGVTDIGDAMRRLPGVNLRDYGGSGGMKTVSVRGLGTQHTGVVYDGTILSDVQGGQIDLSRYALDNLASLVLNIGDSDDIFMPARDLGLHPVNKHPAQPRHARHEA
jgi:outer membrane cobalamin receptor